MKVDREPIRADMAGSTERLRDAREKTGRKAMLLSADFTTPHRNAVLAYDAANEIGLGIAIARPSGTDGPAAPPPPAAKKAVQLKPTRWRPRRGRRGSPSGEPCTEGLLPGFSGASAAIPQKLNPRKMLPRSAAGNRPGSLETISRPQRGTIPLFARELPPSVIAQHRDGPLLDEQSLGIGDPPGRSPKSFPVALLDLPTTGTGVSLPPPRRSPDDQVGVEGFGPFQASDPLLPKVQQDRGGKLRGLPLGDPPGS